MSKSLFTAPEMSILLLAAYKVAQDSDSDSYFVKLERVFLDKLCASAEQERLLGLSPKGS